MNPTENTTASSTESISLEFELPHAPKKVWRALTDPALLTEWLLPVTGLELVVDNAFTLKTQSFPGWDGTVRCRVLSIDEPKSLSYAWVVGEMSLDTVVTFTLTPTEAGTHLSVVQSGFRTDQKKNSGGARYGWKMMGGKLVELLARLP